MRYLLIIMASAVLTSCGDYHYSRSGKIRTARVQTASKDKVESQPKELLFVEENAIYTESIAPREHIVLDSPEQETVLKLEKQDLEETPVQIETLDKQELIETSDQQAPIQVEKKESKKKSKKAPKKKRKIKIDWGQVLFYSVAAILLAALVIGLIYAPLITLSVLSTLLVILIIVIVVAIIAFFSAIFDAIFDLF